MTSLTSDDSNSQIWSEFLGPGMRQRWLYRMTICKAGTPHMSLAKDGKYSQTGSISLSREKGARILFQLKQPHQGPSLDHVSNSLTSRFKRRRARPCPSGSCFITQLGPNQPETMGNYSALFDFITIHCVKRNATLWLCVKVLVMCVIFIRDKLLPVGGQHCSRLVSQLLANKYGRVDLLVSLALFICWEETSTREVRPESGYG